MKLCRYELNGQASFGLIEDGQVTRLLQAPWLGVAKAPEPAVPLSQVKLLTPTEASKVVAVGQNYRKHAEEMGKPVPAEPLIFLKPSTALNAHAQPVFLPPASKEVHHEAELGLVIGRKLSRASEAEASDAIFALTCVNDVTARDIQKKEIQHTRSKSYDTFACVGPWMVTGLSPSDLRISCKLNGLYRQDSRTSDMIFSPERLVSFISHVMTLLPGDIISTGTPSGVGPVQEGDKMEIEVEGIGVLMNPVQRRP